MPTLNEDITKYLLDNGAAMIGFADLKEIDAAARDNLPYGISIGIALNPEVVTGIKIGPTAEYHGEYKKVNNLLDNLSRITAQFLINKGYKAEPRLATVGEDKATLTAKLPHKTTATRAGLGWIGKNNLLITRLYGPAVRLVTVLTDAPVTTGQSIDKSLCGHCRHCVDACPAHALTGENWEAGLPREKLFDAFACRGMARNLTQKLIGEAVSICGLCITACPWTQRYLKRENSSK
jgi:epoxyqueuosine reductase QueG